MGFSGVLGLLQLTDVLGSFIKIDSNFKHLH